MSPRKTIAQHILESIAPLDKHLDIHTHSRKYQNGRTRYVFIDDSAIVVIKGVSYAGHRYCFCVAPDGHEPCAYPEVRQ